MTEKTIPVTVQFDDYTNAESRERVRQAARLEAMKQALEYAPDKDWASEEVTLAHYDGEAKQVTLNVKVRQIK